MRHEVKYFFRLLGVAVQRDTSVESTQRTFVRIEQTYRRPRVFHKRPPTRLQGSSSAKPGLLAGIRGVAIRLGRPILQTQRFDPAARGNTLISAKGEWWGTSVKFRWRDPEKKWK